MGRFQINTSNRPQNTPPTSPRSGGDARSGARALQNLLAQPEGAPLPANITLRRTRNHRNLLSLENEAPLLNRRQILDVDAHIEHFQTKPSQVLLNLFRSAKANSTNGQLANGLFVKFYENGVRANGLDLGGLSRSFVSNLMNGICTQQRDIIKTRQLEAQARVLEKMGRKDQLAKTMEELRAVPDHGPCPMHWSLSDHNLWIPELKLGAQPNPEAIEALQSLAYVLALCMHAPDQPHQLAMGQSGSNALALGKVFALEFFEKLSQWKPEDFKQNTQNSPLQAFESLHSSRLAEVVVLSELVSWDFPFVSLMKYLRFGKTIAQEFSIRDLRDIYETILKYQSDSSPNLQIDLDNIKQHADQLIESIIGILAEYCKTSPRFAASYVVANQMNDFIKTNTENPVPLVRYSATDLEAKIQGKISNELVLANLTYDAPNTPKDIRDYFTQWISERGGDQLPEGSATLEEFLLLLSGSRTLGGNQLTIHYMDLQPPDCYSAYHTCTYQMDLGPVTSYEAFCSLLEGDIKALRTSGDRYNQH